MVETNLSSKVSSTLKDWKNEKSTTSLVFQKKKRKRDALVGTSIHIFWVYICERKLTTSTSVPNTSSVATATIMARNSSNFAFIVVSTLKFQIIFFMMILPENNVVFEVKPM